MVSLLARKQPDYSSGTEKKTSHEGWEEGKTVVREQSQSYSAHQKTRFLTFGKGNRRTCPHISTKTSQLLLFYARILWSGEKLAAFRFTSTALIRK